MSIVAAIVLGAAWVIWVAPFAVRKRARNAAKIDPRARWGILLQVVAYICIWFGPYWLRPTENWRLALAIPFFIAGDLLAWNGVRALGRQWRVGRRTQRGS